MDKKPKNYGKKCDLCGFRLLVGMETGRFIYKSISVGATQGILGDPGADSRGEGKSKRAENKARRKVKNGSSGRSLLFFVPYFSACLEFPSPPLSAPGSPRMYSRQLKMKLNFMKRRSCKRTQFIVSNQ